MCWRRLKGLPRGSIYTTLMELGPEQHNEDGLLEPNSIMVLKALGSGV